LPTLAIKSIEQTLKLRILFFEVTGKVGRERQTLREHMWSTAFGLCTISVAFWLRSPIFAPSVAVSLMFLLGPLMCFTEKMGLMGFLSRQCGVVPYLVLIGIIAGGK
jgi:hypothetical protein